MSSPTQSKTPSLAKHSIPPKVDSPSAQHHLIYFITGNPGLVSLYENFLNTLHTLLSESPSISPDSDIFSIYGQDLAGYETATSFSENDKRTPYTLEEVIEVSMTSLEDLRIESGPRKGQPYDSVIIISHSLGTYMALEIIQRLRKRASPVNVTAAVLLFATVTNIGGSPNGLKFTRLFKIPGFAKKASTAAKLLLDRVPAAALRWILTNFSRNPADAAAKITSFLKSRMGIWQTL
jgi:pimeloyl-ACP methyl ester carboxylesterase